MKKLIFLPSMRLWLGISLWGYFLSCAAQPAVADVEAKEKNREIIELSEFQSPITNTSGLVSQSPAPTNPPVNPPSVSPEKQESVVITSVKANPTQKGVEIILETNQGDKLQVANRSTGNNFIADITGGQLSLPNGDAFAFKSKSQLQILMRIPCG